MIFSFFLSKAGLILVFLAIVSCSLPAQASFLFCNETRFPVEAAFGHRDQGVWQSQGWWKIAPKACARVYDKDLSQRFYFYFARTVLPSSSDFKKMKKVRVWKGKYTFCVDKQAFKIEGDGHCSQRDYFSQGFREIDVGVRQRNYKLVLDEKGGSLVKVSH